MGDTVAGPVDTSSTGSEASSLDTANSAKDGYNVLVWKARFCFMTFFLSKLLQITMVSQYALYRETVNKNGHGSNYFNQTLDNFRKACLDSNLSKEDDSKWQNIQKEASLMVTLLNALELLPAVPTVIFLGLWSDVTEKRTPLMWLPCLGTVVYSLVILLDYLASAGDWILYMGATFSGICGGHMLFISGGASLLAHIATKEQLTFNFSFIEIAAALSASIGNITAGYMLHLTGFTAPLIYLLAVSLLALFANAFLVNDVKEPQPLSSAALRKQVKAMCSLCHCSIPWSSVIMIYFFIFQLYVFVHVGLERTNVLFLEMKPICFDAKLIGWWLSTQGVLESIGTLLAVVLFFHCLGDSGLNFLGYTFRIAACICLAFSTNRTLVFVSLIFMSLQRIPLSTIRSAVSKITDMDKQGTMFGLLHSGEAVVAFLGPFVFNVLFTTTVSVVPNPVYILATAVTVTVTLLTCGSILLRRKCENNMNSEYLSLNDHQS